MTLEKRLSDAEQSIKVIAQYVREQSEKLESEVNSLKGTEAMYDAKPEIEQIKANVESLRSSMQVAAPLDEDRIKKSIQILRNEFDNFRNEASPKLQYIDKKTDKLRETVETVSLADIDDIKRHVDRVDKKIHETLAMKEEIDDVEETLTKMKTIANRLKGFDAASYREEFDRHMNDMFGKFEAGDMKKVSDIAEHMKSVEAGDMKKLTQLAEQLKDAEIKDIKSISENLKHFEKLEADDMKKLTQLAGQLKETEVHDIKSLSEKLKHFESFEADDVKKLAEMSEQLKGLELHEVKDIKNMTSKLRHLEKLEADEAKKLVEMVDQLKETEVHDIRNLAKRMKEAKEAVEEDAVSRISIEKRLADMEASAQKFEKHMDDTVQQLKSLEIKDIKQLNASLEHLQGIELEELKGIAGTIKEAKEALEEESINRLSTEKRLASMEEKVDKASEITNHIENIEGLDMQKLSSRINDMESNMKLSTVRLLTQQLNEFAKAMDRRLPNVVSREEYMRQIADLNQRVRTVEAPDLSPLGARVERLEKKVDEVASMMRQMYDRVPIVVE